MYASRLAILPPLVAVSGACGHWRVDTPLIRRRQHHGQHALVARRPDDPDPALVGLAGDRMAVAHLFHLIRDDIVACDMRDIPGIPDEATDEEQRICRTLRYI